MEYKRLIQDTIEHIEENLKEELSVADIASRSGISSWHFQRLFHRMIGETIGSYVRRRRLSCSIDDLRDGDRKVIDIALDYQFESPEAYSRSFKSEFGFSPLQFRKTGVKIIPTRKAILDPKRLEYVIDHLKVVPEIVEIEPINVVGVWVSLISPLSRRSEYMDAITSVWKEYVPRESEIPNKLGAIKVGVIDGMAASKYHIHDDRMEYMASTAVTSLGPLPEGLSSYVIPGGKYAVFEGKGYHEQTQFIIDHVYSAWLPNNDFERAEGPEFTWLDHGISPLDPVTSVVKYYLPLK